MLDLVCACVEGCVRVCRGVCVQTYCILNILLAGAIYSTGKEQELMFMYQNTPRMIKLLTFCYHNFEPV